MVCVMTKLGDRGGWKVAPLSVLQLPKPPRVALFGKDLNDITVSELQFIWPLRDVTVCYHHLEDT